MEEDISPLDEVLMNRRQNKREKDNIDRTVSGVGDNVSEAVGYLASRFYNLSEKQQKEMITLLQKDGMKINNLHEIPKPPKPEIDINFSGIEHLEVETANITGLSELLYELKKLIENVKNIKLSPPVIPPFPAFPKIPEITIPEIKVPEPKVTVNVPPPTIIMKERKPGLFEKKEKEVQLVEENPIFVNGELDGFDERYSDGSVTKSRGMSTGSIKYTYARHR